MQVTGFKEIPNVSPDDLFELKAIIIHRGGAYGGHYHAYIRDELDEGNWNVKAPEKYAAEPKPIQKVINVGIEKSNTENPDKSKKKNIEQKEQDLMTTKQVVEFDYDECDFPYEYHNKNLRKGWFDFNDESVSAIPFGRLRKQFGGNEESAYILIYKMAGLSAKLVGNPKIIPQYFNEQIQTQNLIRCSKIGI